MSPSSMSNKTKNGGSRVPYIIIAAAAICLILIGAGVAYSWFVEGGSPQGVNDNTTDSSQSQPASSVEESISVSVIIDSSRAEQYGYPAQIADQTVTLDEGSTVYDALCATGLSLGGSSSFVTSIDGLGEKPLSESAGWLYFVDGASPSLGADSFKLSGGETITWVYTLDGGNDI